MTKYNINITQRAFSDIGECVSFVKNVSKEAAKKLYKEIINSIKSLETFPNAYPEIEGLKIKETTVRKMPIHNGTYVILYKVEGSVVVVYNIFDVRKNNLSLLLNM